MKLLVAALEKFKHGQEENREEGAVLLPESGQAGRGEEKRRRFLLVALLVTVVGIGGWLYIELGDDLAILVQDSSGPGVIPATTSAPEEQMRLSKQALAGEDVADVAALPSASDTVLETEAKQRLVAESRQTPSDRADDVTAAGDERRTVAPQPKKMPNKAKRRTQSEARPMQAVERSERKDMSPSIASEQTVDQRLSKQRSADERLQNEESKSQQLLDLARQAERAMDLEGAKDYYTQAIRIEPLDRAAALGRARVLARLGETAAAQQIYRGLLERDRDDADALAGLALSSGTADPAAWQARLVAALEKNPDHAGLYSALALLWSEQKQWRAAARAYAEAARLEPTAELYYNLAVCLDRAGEYGEALTAYRKALSTPARMGDSLDTMAIEARIRMLETVDPTQ